MKQLPVPIVIEGFKPPVRMVGQTGLLYPCPRCKGGFTIGEWDLREALHPRALIEAMGRLHNEVCSASKTSQA